MEVSDTEKDIQAERSIVVCLEMPRIKLERRRVVVNGPRKVSELALGKSAVVVEIRYGVVFARLGPLYCLSKVIEGRRGVTLPLPADTSIVPGQRMRRLQPDGLGVIRYCLRQVVQGVISESAVEVGAEVVRRPRQAARVSLDCLL